MAVVIWVDDFVTGGSNVDSYTLRKVVVSLKYDADKTRYMIDYIDKLSHFQSSPLAVHWVAVKRVISKW